jgi:polyhydroxybutyrate depolymerase
VAQAHRDRIDDVAFFDAMLAAVAKDYPIDEKRVYAMGISNGGMFSHYLAAHRADKLAAIAPVVGGIADPFHRKFMPAGPVSVLISQGTKDPIVPYDGGGGSAAGMTAAA